MSPASLIAFAAAAALAAGQGAAEDSVARGHDLVQSRCSGCHAVEATGSSPNPAAPPFRTLGARYPLEDLEEAFVEGAYVGHAEMPNFTFDELQVSDLIAYLKQLNAPMPRPR
jgi:mono/diheme cytochrome c family protein